LRKEGIAADKSLSNKQEITPDLAKKEAAVVAVRDLLQDPDIGLDLELIQGHEGLDNGIRSPRIQKLGMTLAGFTGFIHPDRVQVFGSSELNYLRTLDPEARFAAMQRLRKHKICCIVVTKGLEIPKELLQISSEEKMPILRSGALSSVSIEKVASYLEKRLAPRMTIHGVLLDIFGLGVLILGPSGIGKSECALELVLKGHRLITDDYVELMRRGIDRLSGTGGKVLEHHMELRGLGIINIKELFGISATSVSQNIDMAVRLERWNSDADYDRLGLDRPTIEFLGVSIPLIAMPVAPGRNVSTLVEVAARIHLLRQRKPVDDFRLTINN
jgi:HPr kinase/phosphorylase